MRASTHAAGLGGVRVVWGWAAHTREPRAPRYCSGDRAAASAGMHPARTLASPASLAARALDWCRRRAGAARSRSSTSRASSSRATRRRRRTPPSSLQNKRRPREQRAWSGIPVGVEPRVTKIVCVLYVQMYYCLAGLRPHELEGQAARSNYLRAFVSEAAQSSSVELLQACKSFGWQASGGMLAPTWQR